MNCVKAAFRQHRDTAYPHAVIGGVGFFKAVLFQIFDGLKVGHRNGGFFVGVFRDFLVVNVHVGNGQRFLVLNLNGLDGVLAVFLGGGVLLQSRQFRVVLGFLVQLHERADCFGGIGVVLGNLFILLGADAEQVPAVSEQAVVRPVGRGASDGDHGDVVH